MKKSILTKSVFKKDWLNLICISRPYLFSINHFTTNSDDNYDQILHLNTRYLSNLNESSLFDG